VTVPNRIDDLPATKLWVSCKGYGSRQIGGWIVTTSVRRRILCSSLATSGLRSRQPAAHVCRLYPL
jgi:hypothetical protein